MIIGKIKTKIFQHRLKRKFPNSQVILNRPVDMSRLRIGQYSYGLVNLITFNPSGSVAAGVPAKVIRQRLSFSQIEELESTDYIAALRDLDIKTLKK